MLRLPRVLAPLVAASLALAVAPFTVFPAAAAPAVTGQAAAPLQCMTSEVINFYPNTNYPPSSTTKQDPPNDTCTLAQNGDSVTISITMNMPVQPACPYGNPNATVPNPTCSAYTNLDTSYADDAGNPPLSCPFSPPGSPEAQSTQFDEYWQSLNGRTTYTCSDTFSLAKQAGRDFIVKGHQEVWAASGSVSTASSRNNTSFEDKFRVPLGPPVSSFVATMAPGNGLSYNFDGSASSTTQGSITSYAWTFGDGSTASGVTIGHAFAKEGSYTVRLSVTDSNGVTGISTQTLMVLALDLTATITVADPQGMPLTGASSAAGRPVVATVTLMSAGTAPSPITGVVSSLTVAPEGKLTQTGSGASPSDGYTLQPGQAVSYTVNYTIAGTGSVTLSVTASGTEDGKAQTATAQRTVPLGQPLQVDIAFSLGTVGLATTPLGADTFRLSDNDTGEVPVDVTATVTVTNISGGEQDSISVAEPDLSVADPASNHNPFPMTVMPPAGKAFPRDLGTLAAGVSATISYTLHVTGNQDFHLSQLVLSSDPAFGDTEKSLGSADLHALPTALLLVDLQPEYGSVTLNTGVLTTFDGSVRNLSNTRALDLDPVLTRITGNGGGQTSADGATPTPDGFLAPVTGKVAAGDKVTFHVRVQTMRDGGTRTTLTTTPTGSYITADGTEQTLTSDQIRLTAGTSPSVLHLNDSDDGPAAASQSGDDNGAFVFTKGALEGLRDWCANGFQTVQDLAENVNIGTIGDGVIAAGGIAVDNLKANYELISVIKAELGLHVFWTVLTPAQRSAFAEQVAIDTDAVSTTFTQFHAAINSGVQAYFQNFQNMWQRGDTVGAYRALGHGIGTGVPEALSLIAPEIVLGKVARGLGWGVKAAGAIADTTVARAISLAGKIQESRIAIGTAKALDGVLAGDNLLANGARVLKNSFGLTQRDIDIFTNLAKRRNLLIAVRQRNPISTAWLKTRQFLVKSELLKIKNVDQIDVDFLGYRGKGGLIGRGDYGTVVFKEPDPIHDVVARLNAQRASPDIRKAVLKRFDLREEEWRDYRHLYEQYNDGSKPFDVGFDKKAQGAGGKAKDVRKFHLDEIKTASGRKYYRVQYADLAGILKYVTGDIDIVAILNADGTLPSAAVRALLYDDLLAAVGMQHGDTFAWLKDGELISKTQAKLLSDHLPGNEQLAVFGHDGGCLAGYFDPKLTVFDTTAHEAYATFVGAYTTPLQKLARYTSLKLGGIK